MTLTIVSACAHTHRNGETLARALYAWAYWVLQQPCWSRWHHMAIVLKRKLRPRWWYHVLKITQEVCTRVRIQTKSLWLCRQLSLLSYSLIMHVVILMDYWYRENTWINIIKFFRYFSQQVSSSVSFPKYVTRVLYCLWQAEWGLVNTHLIFKNSILLGFWKVMWCLGIYQDFLVKKIKRSKYAKVPSAGSLRFGGCPGFFREWKIETTI